MAKFCYEHPDLVREGIIWTGKQPKPVTVAAPEVVEAIEIPNPYGKLCEICGKPLRSKMQKKYCSPDCRESANSRVAAQRHHVQALAVVRACQYCGRDFRPAENGRNKYCSDDCYRLANNRYGRIRSAIKRGEVPEAVKERFCVVCGVKLPETLHHAQTTCSPECRQKFKSLYSRERYRRKKEAQNGETPDNRTI